MTDESVCLDLPDGNDIKAKVKAFPCSGLSRQKWEYDKNVSNCLIVYDRLKT